MTRESGSSHNSIPPPLLYPPRNTNPTTTTTSPPPPPTHPPHPHPRNQQGGRAGFRTRAASAKLTGAERVLAAAPESSLKSGTKRSVKYKYSHMHETRPFSTSHISCAVYISFSFSLFDIHRLPISHKPADLAELAGFSRLNQLRVRQEPRSGSTRPPLHFRRA